MTETDTTRLDDFERTVIFLPAFDKRDSDPSKNYGIHGVGVRFVLKGPEGAVQFLLFTGWHLPHVQEELVGKCHTEHHFCSLKPMPADLGYHSPTPHYEGQEPISDDCEFIGGPCYYDGSTLNAEPVFNRLLAEGDAGVWDELEAFYHSTFEVKEEVADHAL